MAFGPRGFVIPAPTIPDAPCQGLFDLVTPDTIEDPHWMSGGVEWEDYLCSPAASGFIGECPPATGYTKVTESEMSFCHADPFYVYGSFDCAPGGRPTEEAFDIARERLLAWEQWEVERILWTGESANGPVEPSFSLGNSSCDITPVILSPNGPLSPSAALAVIEEFLADLIPCGGVIHAPHGMSAFFAGSSLIERVGDRYYTVTGIPVVFGAGYPGTGPGGVAPTAGATWMFATGPLTIVRSEVMMVPSDKKEAINRNINKIEVRAERAYAVGYSCGVAAVETTLTCSCC